MSTAACHVAESTHLQTLDADQSGGLDSKELCAAIKKLVNSNNKDKCSVVIHSFVLD